MPHFRVLQMFTLQYCSCCCGIIQKHAHTHAPIHTINDKVLENIFNGSGSVVYLYLYMSASMHAACSVDICRFDTLLLPASNLKEKE